MKQIVVFPRGQLDSKDRERLTKNDIVVVEADEPEKVVTVLPVGGVVTGDDIFYAAMEAIKGNTYTMKDFAGALCTRVLAREKLPTK